MSKRGDDAIPVAATVPEAEAEARLRALGAATELQQKGRQAGYSRNARKPRHLIVRTPDRVIRAMLSCDERKRPPTVELSELVRAEGVVRRWTGVPTQAPTYVAPPAKATRRRRMA